MKKLSIDKKLLEEVEKNLKQGASSYEVHSSEERQDLTPNITIERGD